jgi:phosphoribosylglycinamide formyltransferase 1
MDPFRIAVLVSGTGSNLQAIIDRLHGRGAVEVVAVASNRPDARGLERARGAGIETGVFERGTYPDREARDLAIADWLREREVELVILAGYMELLSAEFLRRFPDRVINVHPALLPSFPGLDAIAQAVAHGVKVAGVTVHFVDEGVDTGPIIMQQPVTLAYTRSIEEVEAEIHRVEHELLPRAVELIAAGKVRIDPNNPRAVIVDEL